ncbi:MAG: aldolase/citrate lyase family protein [Anaerolineaceae bacterium]|nr:aldolase/citrate lyase family protein [Anaerolineaceae bacterium]
MRNNLLKAKLERGEPCRGIWLGVPSAQSARLLARLQVDWLVIDAEHAPIGIETQAQMVAAIVEANGPAPLVRISQATTENIKFALDAGAYGIIAPMINTVEEAERVVTWSKFPPTGQRSFGSSYAGLAFDLSMPEYRKQANDQTLTMIQIESQAALSNLDGMFSVPGIDLAFVGPVDLSISLGLDPLPENPHPIFLEALDEIKRAAQAHHLPLGIFCSNGKAAAERIRQGFLLVNVASDTGLLQRGLAAELEDSR